MLLNTIKRFVALSKQIGLKGSDPQIKELMTTLRRSGFSSSQISELSGWRWSSTLVRQYTKKWKGVDIELDSQRNNIITSIRELASSNKDIDDVEKFLVLEKTVKAKGLNLDEVAELNAVLKDLDLRPNEMAKIVNLSRILVERNINPNTLQHWISLDQELVEMGFNKEARLYLSMLCEKNGGVLEVLRAVRQYINLDSVRTHRMSLDDEVKILAARKNQLEMDIRSQEKMFKATIDAYYLGFDFHSLSMISVLATDLGGPYQVVEAIRKYRSMLEIDKDIEDHQKTLNRIKREINDKGALVSALNFTLKETEAVYEGNSTVRMVVRLLVDPRGLKMDRCEVAGLLLYVLDSSLERIDESIELLKIPDPMWNDIIESIKSLADRLHQFKARATLEQDANT